MSKKDKIASEEIEEVNNEELLNENQDNDSIINAIKETTNLKTSKYLKRLNACDVYYLK